MSLNFNKENYKSIPLKYHLLFWNCYFTFNIIRWGSYFDDYIYSLKSNLVEFPIHIVLVYINIYYFIPKFLVKKQYKTYILCLFLSLGLVYIIRTGLIYFLVTENIWPEASGNQKAFTFNHIVAVIIGELYVVALVTTIKLTVVWINQRKYVEELSKVNLQTELKFLRMQIQPHFFFNTLNSLYSLTLDKSDEAPEVVLKLSNIMEYVIYEAKENKVKLSKEINLIQDYIDLQKIRHSNSVDIQLEIKGDLENAEIPPLVLLSFIENSFKHGKKDGDFYIHIYIKRKKDGAIFFSVENNYVCFTPEKKLNGVGNNNVKRRLDLLYGENYNLNIIKDKAKFKVELLILNQDELK
ncbi:Histidine kinase [Tenacibaculum sp. 190524A05c]|uniref:sensor histidine kinase n=1 Tax=Tenacibaculum platacis TaxID=3137852 RepID=UPI0031FAC07F